MLQLLEPTGIRPYLTTNNGKTWRPQRSQVYAISNIGPFPSPGIVELLSADVQFLTLLATPVLPLFNFEYLSASLTMTDPFSKQLRSIPSASAMLNDIQFRKGTFWSATCHWGPSKQLHEDKRIHSPLCRYQREQKELSPRMM